MLEVYSSSAGSGKTYTLTREYLRMALEKPGFGGFAQLLAITFTKKATAELKDRILEELYRISRKESSMPELTPYADKARLMLTAILHGYSDFRVSTIDSFFSEIIRGFAREQKLSTGFSLEIDTDAVLQEALERLYQRIGAEPELTLLISEWVMERVKEGESWDIRRQLSSFARQGFNDTYRLLYREAATFDEEIDERFLARKVFLSNEINKIEEGFFEIAEPALGMLGPEPDFSPFYYKAKGPAAWLHALAKRDTDSIKPPNSYARQVAEGKDIVTKNNFVHGSPRLAAMVTELVEHADATLQRYYSLKAVSENLVTTYLLGYIMREVQQVKQERNIFLVADLGYFLSRITEENDAPFIYERIGAFIRHFLIDEMQDTSGVQWEALRPLVDNAVAGLEGQRNFEQGTSLVVGDIKQAIYRWRNGDWKLLLHKIRDDIGGSRIRQKNLNTNYRSLERVVGFNNRAFEKLPALVADAAKTDSLKKSLTEELMATMDRHLELIGQAYQGVEQRVGRQEPGAWDGYVEVGFMKEPVEIPLENSEEVPSPSLPTETAPDEPRTQEETLEGLVIERVVNLQDRGFHGGDICLLVRTHSEGQKIGAWMQRAHEAYSHKTSKAGVAYDFRFTSADTLVIGASSVVRLLVHLMGYLKDGEDRISMACILHEYYVYVLRRTPPDLNEVFGLGEGSPEEFHDFFVSKMPEGFAEKVEELSHLPVHEVAEELVQFFRLYEVVNETAYLLAFLDQALAYQMTHRLDVKSFLDFYEDKGRFEKLALADDGTSIRIMTVHKAKGLEFNAVILPFCHWPLDHGGSGETLLWEHVADMPGIPWAALKYRSELIQSDFATHYLNEKVAAHLENLNLLYVAFTRAAQELYALCLPRKGRANVGTVLNTWLEQEANSLEENPFMMERVDSPTLLSFRSGKPAEQKTAMTEKKEARAGIAKRLAAPMEEPLQFEYYSWRKRRLHVLARDARQEDLEPETRRARPSSSLIKLMITASAKGASAETVNELRYRGLNGEDQILKLEEQVAEWVPDPDLAPYYDPAFSWRIRPLIASPEGERAQPHRMGIVTKNGDKTVRIACLYPSSEALPEHAEEMQKIRRIAVDAGLKIEACAVIYLPQKRVIEIR